MDYQNQQIEVNTKPWMKLVLVGVIILLSIPALLFIAAKVIESKVKTEIISQLNEQLSVPVEVKGSIDLSLLKHFPYASLTFNQVSIDDKLRKGKAKLINVDEFSLLCNMYSLFTDNIEVKKVLFKDGSLHLYFNEKGLSNSDILKPSKSDNESSLSVQIKSAEFRRIKFEYTDKTQNLHALLDFEKSTMHGNFSASQFELDASSRLKVMAFNVNGEHFLEGKTISNSLSILIDKASRKYSIRKGEVSIGETVFTVNGFFAQGKTGAKLDFTFNNSGSDIQKLFELFPEKYRQNFADAEGSGAYAISATVKGVANKSTSPEVKVIAELRDSELKLGKYNKFLKSVNATARYEMDAAGSDRLTISNFNCTLNDLPFRFSLALKNLSNPEFDFTADGTLHLNEISSFIPDTVLQDLEGSVRFSNFKLKGKKDDFYSVENSSLSGSGLFELKEIEFRQNGITYGNINGQLTYDTQVIEAQNFTLNFLSTDFNFTGTIRNLFAFIYNLSAKRKSNDVVLGVSGAVKVKTFNLSGIIDTYNKKNRPQTLQREKLNIAEVMNMSGNLDVQIERFVFRKMVFEDLKTNLQMSPGVIRINKLEAKGMGGEVRTSGTINFTAENNLEMRMDVTANALDIPKIFYQCDNFGQTTLTDRHLKGTISTTLNLNAVWKNYKVLDENSLSAVVDFQVKNGELVGFEPLRAASKFIRVEELERIRFQDLSNTIQIANRTLTLPEFEIKTSALNLIIFGKHYFNNDVDYHFKINLHKLLANKFQRNTQNESFIEDDPYQGLNIYLSMSGNLSNPVIKYDKAATRNKLKDDFRKEKDVLKALLNNRTLPKDEEENKREEKYFDTRSEPQFMDFDEEPK